MKTMYIFLATLLLGIISCTSESEVISHGSRSDYKVSFSIHNGATLTREAGAANGAVPVSGETPIKKDFTTTALEREKSISSLYAVVFDKTDDCFYKTIKIETTSSSDTYEFNMGSRGSYKLLLVANADEALAQKLEALTSSSTLTDFSALVASQSPGEGVDATNLLMVSQIDTDVAVSPHITTQLGTIELIRLSARFDFYNQVKGLKMTKITFKKRAVSSLLLESGDPSKITFSTDKVYTSANGLSPLSAVGVIYGYEDEVKNDYEFILESTYNDQVLKPDTIKIKDRAIERNHLYNIILTANESGITPSPDDPTDDNEKYKINIHVADWNDADTFGFVGEQLVNKDAPTFEASGAGVTTIPATKTNFPVVQTSYEANSVTILAISASSSDSQLICDGDLPSGWHIIDKGAEAISHKNGQLTHQFIIEIDENTTKQPRLCQFKIANIFNPTACAIFTLWQSEYTVNPLKFVAEYNLASSGIFATEQSISSEKNGFFSGSQVLEGKIAPAGYHVPSVSEFRSIIPPADAFSSVSNSAEGSVTINDETFIDGTYDSKYVSDNLAYALRFKDADGKPSAHTCAFRYQWDDVHRILNITCRPLGSIFSGDIDTISNESYWNIKRNKDEIRFFPACGSKNSINGSVINGGRSGRYWSSSECIGNKLYEMYFSKSNCYSSSGLKYICSPVRVFRD